MGCFTSKSSHQPNITNSPVNQPAPQPIPQPPPQQPQRPPLAPRQNQKPASQDAKIKVESKLTPDQVKASDFTPASTQKGIFPYNCPICFKYLSNILVTQCCKNYICHLCISELQNKHVNFEIACPHCKAQPLIVEDVDLSVSVKRYFDSPYGTLNNNTNQGNKWITQLPMIGEDKDDIDLKEKENNKSFIVEPEEHQIALNLYATS
ncbi:unnamed protein product [Blepharisma stoltei]|uniref:RING-type domain-containing protein n=1 Tax=Blepharisma stoltei TaxID=1481888 RepID=A0AAU9ICV6_9CILI|nr:unnamed protein product [Blepharisma stoltei]